MGRLKLTGFELLNEMTNEQLVEEISLANRECLEKQDRQYLLNTVVKIRVENYRRKLMAEGDVEDPPTFLGIIQ